MIVRWVHAQHVREDGRLKPMAFPVQELQELNTNWAPSVINAQKISAETLTKAKDKACMLCNRRKNNSSAWPDIQECSCSTPQHGMRGATTSHQKLLSVSIPTITDKCTLKLTGCTSKINPGHEVLDTQPELEHRLSPAACLELADALSEAFDTIMPVNILFTRIPLQ